MSSARDANGLAQAGQLPTDPAAGTKVTAEPLTVERILERLRDLARDQRGAAAMGPDVLAFAARLDERTAAWVTLYDGLKALRIGVNPWKRAVRAERKRRGMEERSRPDEEPDHRPEVLVNPDEHTVNDTAVRALAMLDNLYQRGWLLVETLQEDPGIQREGLVPPRRIREVPVARLRELMSKAVKWITIREKEDGEAERVQVHPPDWAVRAMHSRGDWDGMRILSAIVEAPVIRPNGTMITLPGYDDTTGIFYWPTIDYPEIPHSPTWQQARDAADLLLEVVTDFPFEREVDPSAWLAALLTPFARYTFRGPAPMFVVSGNVRGCGKGKLVQVIALIATGRETSAMSQLENEEEERKRITSVALAGDTVALIDNISKPFGNGTLDGMLTSTFWGERLLGLNDRPRLSLITTWYGTGNNVTFRAGYDTARRCCVIRLDSPLQRPEARADLKHPELLRYVAQNRARLAAAALTILRGWLASDTTVYDRHFKLTPWGSYDGWSRIVRGALVWLGLPDPFLAAGSSDEAADADADALDLLLAGWSEAVTALGGTIGAVTVAHVLQVMQENDERRRMTRPESEPPPLKFPKLREALAELIPGVPAGKLPNAKQIGAQLRKHKKRIGNGYRRLMCWKSNGDNVWTVEVDPRHRPRVEGSEGQ